MTPEWLLYLAEELKAHGILEKNMAYIFIRVNTILLFYKFKLHDYNIIKYAQAPHYVNVSFKQN